VHAAAKTETQRTGHARRRPEDTVLYGVVSDQLHTFLTVAESTGREVPAFVARELTRYLECGGLAYGFVRVHCRRMQA
jgi:16S rRNA C1402 (ribose-2'-O) methylase RsmI